jgi:hypothetical protein
MKLVILEPLGIEPDILWACRPLQDQWKSRPTQPVPRSKEQIARVGSRRIILSHCLSRRGNGDAPSKSCRRIHRVDLWRWIPVANAAFGKKLRRLFHLGSSRSGFCMILSLYRNLTLCDRAVREGKQGWAEWF